MIDIHAHILPDLDDGSEDMEESLEMAELSVESGVEIMAATPHSNQMGRIIIWLSFRLTQIPGGSGNVWRISLIRGRYH